MQIHETFAPEIVDCGEMMIGSPLDNIVAGKIYIAVKAAPKANTRWAYLFVDKNGETIAAKCDTVHGNTRTAELTAAVEVLGLVGDDENAVLMSGSPLLLRVLDGKCASGRCKELYDAFCAAAQRPNITVTCLQGVCDEYQQRCEDFLVDDGKKEGDNNA